jgi:hypothetical protein
MNTESTEPTNSIDSEVSDQSDNESTSPAVVEQPSEPKPEPKPKIRLGGQEVEVDSAVAEMKKSADSKYQEAAKLRKEAQEQMELLKYAKENPLEFFKVTGINAKEFAEKILLEELEDSLLSETERELKKYKKAEKEHNERKAKEDERAKLKQQQELEAQYASEVENEILEVLKEQGIKATPRNIAKVADIMLASLESGGSRLHAKDAFSKANESLRAEALEYLSSFSPETIEKDYPEFYKAVLSHSASKVAKSTQILPDDGAPASKKSQKQQSYSEFWKDIRQGK